MKRVLSFLCAVAMVLTMCTFYMGEALSVVAEDAEAPEVSAEDIVWIETYEQLIAEMAKDENAGMTLKFKNNIEASDWKFSSVDTEKMTVTGTRGDTTVTINVDTDSEEFANVDGELGANSEYAFTLVDGINIDGNGCAITGMHVVDAANKDSIYFLNQIGENSTVKNVRFENCVFVTGSSKIAPLAGDVYGNVIDCETYASVTIASRYTDTGEVNIGGIAIEPKTQGVGEYTSNMTLQDYYNGLMGEYKVTSIALIDGCVNNTTILVTRTDSGTDNTDDGKALIVGGIVARTGGGIIRNCVNNADITTYGKVYGLGGIVGLCNPVGDIIGYERIVNIYNCANHGKITAVTNWEIYGAGGIVGYLDRVGANGGQFNLANCYNSGELNCKYFNITGSTHDAAYGMVGFISNISGVPKWIGEQGSANGGYKVSASFYGGSALNFIKGDAASGMTVAPADVKVGYNEVQNTTFGSFSFTEVFAAGPNNDEAPKSFGKVSVNDILNISYKYLEGAKAWTTNAAGDPTVNQSSERSYTAMISTKEQLDEFREMFSLYCKELGSAMTISATLANDIDLNEYYTFGYDATNKAGTITYDGATYYLGYGNGLTAGKIYNSDLTTEATDIKPYQWTPFESEETFQGSNVAKEKKVTMKLDGAGYTVKGLYINSINDQGKQQNKGNQGFARIVNNVHFENLTLDGLIVSTTGGRVGAFIAGTANDSTIKNCVNNATVLVNRTAGSNVGGIVGHVGAPYGANTMYERMPNRICYVTGCVNNGDVYVANGSGDKVGGVVGWLTQGEVSYCTNTGNVSINNSSSIAGVVGHAQGGTSAAKPAAYGSDTAEWGASIGLPYQTTLRVIGNTNVGTITCPTATNIASVVNYSTKWAAHGAWGLINTTYQYKDVPAFAPSEFIVQYNVGKITGTVKDVYKQDARDASIGLPTYKWTDGKDLSITTLFTNSVKNNVSISSTDATVESRYKALSKVYPAAKDFNRGYMMWIDYDYTTDGIPHPVKVGEKTVEGLTVSLVNNKLELGIGNAEALMLLNDTVNYITTAPAVVAGVKVNSIYDVYNIAADAATDKTNVETYLLAVTGKAAADRYTSLAGATVKLTADIDLGGAEWTPLGDDVPYFNVVNNGTDLTYMEPVYSFQAKFEGQGHTISNFTFPRASGVAFIGAIKQGTTDEFNTIENVKFADVNIESDGEFVAIAVCYTNNVNLYDIIVEESCSVFAKGGSVAGIVCQQQGEMARCDNYADISSEGGFVGGVAVKNFCHNIYDNENHGKISTTTADYCVGGVSAYAYNKSNKFDRNKNYGEIYAPNATYVGGVFGNYASSAAKTHTDFENHGNVTGNARVGGVIGYDGTYTPNDTFEGFVNTGNVIGGTQFVGGIVGITNSNNIVNCRNIGTITGKSNPSNHQVNVGGIVGKINAGSIKNCTNEGAVIGNDWYVGGIAGFADGSSSISTIEECKNNGDVTGLQYVGGVAGNIQNNGSKIINSTNSGTITGKDAFAGGIAGMTANATVKGCENTGTVTTDPTTNNKPLYSAGIVATAPGTTNIIQNINRGTVDAINSIKVAGIVAAIDGPNTVVEGNVNSGDITGKDYLAGINVWALAKNILIKGNVNYGAVKNTSVSAAITCDINNGDVEICYNANFSDSPVFLGALGRYLATTSTNRTPKVYGNIDAAGLPFFVEDTSKGHGFVANNYSLGRTDAATLIGGKAVTEDQFKFGEVADIINNLSYTADKFLANNENYLYNEGSDEKILPGGIAEEGLTEGDLVAPAGFEEEDYMVQTIGVDKYPLPKLAAEIIHADRTMTAPEAVNIVPDAPEAPSDTAKFYGYIDIDRNVYKPGYVIEGEPKFLYPVFVDFYTAYGAGVRTTDPMGIRFQTLVKDDLSILNNDEIYNDFGTVILPADYVEAMMNDADNYENGFDVQAIKDNHVQHIDIENNGWADPSFASVEVKEGYKTYMGSIVRIKEGNYTKQFSGASYMKVQYFGDKDITYITANWQTARTDSATFVDGASYDYSDETGLPRSIVEIAEKALDPNNTKPLSPAVQKYLQGIIDQANTPAA